MNHHCMQWLLHFLAQTWTRITSILQNVTNRRILQRSYFAKDTPFPHNRTWSASPSYYISYASKLKGTLCNRGTVSCNTTKNARSSKIRNRDAVGVTVKRSRVCNTSTHKPAACSRMICMLQPSRLRLKKIINKSLQKRTKLNQKEPMDTAQ